jgi:hypothetical protein
MFAYAFNHDIGKWDTAAVTTTSLMFGHTKPGHRLLEHDERCAT